jgi:uncharacterized protein (TIGR03066 family)
MRITLGCAALLAMTCMLRAADEQIDIKKLYGKWELAEAKKGQSMTLEFKEDMTIHLTVGETGKEVKLEGKYVVSENNRLDVELKYMDENIKEALTIKKLTTDELVTEDSKGKSETMRKKK